MLTNTLSQFACIKRVEQIDVFILLFQGMNTDVIANIIIISVIGSVLIILILLRCYLSCCRNTSELGSVRSLNEIYAPEIDVKEEELPWILSSNKREMIKNQQCCICLQNNVDTQTSCAHNFHVNCIIEWKRRLKNNCPYCKSNSLNRITFYCQDCKISKFEFLFESPMEANRIHMVPKFFLELAQKSQMLVCPTCKQTEAGPESTRIKKSSSTQYMITNAQSTRTNVELNEVLGLRQPVNIELISFASSSRASRTMTIRNSQNETQGSGQAELVTDQRLLIPIQ